MSLYLGGSEISTPYLGGMKVSNVYLGSTLVWQHDPLAGVAIGDSFKGGFYAGIIDTTVAGSIIAADASQTGVRYALIVAGKSLESSSLSYKTSNDTAPSAASTRWDGRTATAAMNSATYPAAQYCAGLDYDDDGASPWYLPALDEMELICRSLRPGPNPNATETVNYATFPGPVSPGANPSSDPAGADYTSNVPPATSVTAFVSGGAQALGSGSYYWSSTESQTATAWGWYFDGSFGAGPTFASKLNTRPVRPVRRLVLS